MGNAEVRVCVDGQEVGKFRANEARKPDVHSLVNASRATMVREGGSVCEACGGPPGKTWLNTLLKCHSCEEVFIALCENCWHYVGCMTGQHRLVRSEAFRSLFKREADRCRAWRQRMCDGRASHYSGSNFGSSQVFHTGAGDELRRLILEYIADL